MNHVASALCLEFGIVENFRYSDGCRTPGREMAETRPNRERASARRNHRDLCRESRCPRPSYSAPMELHMMYPKLAPFATRRRCSGQSVCAMPEKVGLPQDFIPPSSTHALRGTGYGAAVKKTSAVVVC